MEAHPHTDGRAAWPGMLGDRRLRVDRRRDGATRIGKCHEETVALRVHFDAAVTDERLAQEPPVIREHACIGVAELVQQARRPLDVRK
jgi:hypothetical protein